MAASPHVTARATTATTRHSTLLGAVIGAAFLGVLAGPALLSPTSIEWLMRGDWAEHYFGWHYFRIEPWQWPPGTITRYYAPLGTSIGLTDVVPLAAYLLKPFGAWLPQPFQYIGLWWLLCFTLQGALGARLMTRATAHLPTQLLGATLFVLVPSLLARIGHAALCSHWLILWTLLIATRDEPRKWRVWEWAALGLCAGMVQPYLAAMVLPLALGVVLDTPSTPLVRRGRALAALVVVTVIGWWLSGMFILSGDNALAGGGLGYFSMNLLAPITPEGWSRLLPALPVAGDGQRYEGFHYLGAGILLVLVTALALRASRQARDEQEALRPGRWTVVLAVLMAAFALSPKITLGSAVLVDLSSPLLAPLAMFRSSGRFFWPLTYVALAWATTRVCRRLPAGAAAAVLSVAVVLQFVDASDTYRARWQTARDPAFLSTPKPLTSVRWPELMASYQHVVLVPPPQCGRSPVAYEPVMRLAAPLGRSVNAGVISRTDVAAQGRYCETLAADVQTARLQADALYLMTEVTMAGVQAHAAPEVGCEVIDGIGVCAAGLPGRPTP